MFCKRWRAQHTPLTTRKKVKLFIPVPLFAPHFVNAYNILQTLLLCNTCCNTPPNTEAEETETETEKEKETETETGTDT